MKTRYDKEADAMYIRLKEDTVHHTTRVDTNTILDFNKKDEIIGIELLFVKERNLLQKFDIKLLH